MSTVEIIDKAPIKLSEGAIKEVKNLLSEKEVPEGYGLRVGVKGGGCAGFSYILGFDKPSEKDNAYQVDGITVIIEKAHELYLDGTELDYTEGLDNRGFVFNNPNAGETCGCGSSFSA
ncbi:MAG: iron-sulfur cluster assembly accessory protein [Bacteroidetes bacterium]|nr:iron-sulfur cluster assembly accessory protein [Bacteroidota bacterium]